MDTQTYRKNLNLGGYDNKFEKQPSIHKKVSKNLTK